MLFCEDIVVTGINLWF